MDFSREAIWTNRCPVSTILFFYSSSRLDQPRWLSWINKCRRWSTLGCWNRWEVRTWGVHHTHVDKREKVNLQAWVVFKTWWNKCKAVLDQEGWVSHFRILFSNSIPGAGHGSDGEHDEEDGSKEKIVAQIFCNLVSFVLSWLALFPPSSQFFMCSHLASCHRSFLSGFKCWGAKQQLGEWAEVKWMLNKFVDSLFSTVPFYSFVFSNIPLHMY